MSRLSRDEKLHREFDRGNYAAAYETEDYTKACKRNVESAAFTLGFFSSYELHEMGEHEETYLTAYRSEDGQACVALGFIDALDLTDDDDFEDLHFNGVDR